MKTTVDITPLESLRISQPFLFLPKGTGTWAACTPTWIPQLISPSRNFHVGKWSTCIQLLPSRVLGCGPHSRSKRGLWKHVFAMPEERSRESSLVPAPSSICVLLLLDCFVSANTWETYRVYICYSFCPSSKLRSLTTAITLHFFLFLEGPWGQGWLNRHRGQTTVFPLPPATRKWCEFVRLVHGSGCPFGDNATIEKTNWAWWPHLARGTGQEFLLFSMPENAPFNFNAISQGGELSSFPRL